MRKVLVIDDNQDILTVVDTLLKVHNINTLGISDGREVLDAIGSFKPNLILLDIMLGDLDGRTICKQLKANENTKHIPVILFSALKGIDESLKSCGMIDFISKPFDLHEMIEKINKYMPETPDRNQIEKHVIQVVVDQLGVNYTECTSHALIKKDLGANNADIDEIYTQFESYYRLGILKKYLKGDITVIEIIDLIDGFVTKEL